MLPVLFSIGGFEVHSYGVMFALALGSGILAAVTIAEREGIAPAWMWDISLALIVGTVVGGRAEYVRTHWTSFAADPASVFALRDGGVVFYGGFIGALIGVVGTILWHRAPLWRIVDIWAALVPLGHAIGRIGCFLAGCCYGAPTGLPWAVVFPPGGKAPSGVPLHPTQLYEAGFDVLLGVALLWFRTTRALPFRRFDGQTLAALLMLYPTFRVLNEQLRGDEVRGLAFGAITNAQATSVGLFALGAAVLAVRASAETER